MTNELLLKMPELKDYIVTVNKEFILMRVPDHVLANLNIEMAVGMFREVIIYPSFYSEKGYLELRKVNSDHTNLLKLIFK